MYRTVFWTLWEKVRVGWFERIALKHVNYHTWNRLPVQVWCMRQGAQGWCTGMTQRDGMGRKVGGALRMGNTCTPMADSCQCMAKPTTCLNAILPNHPTLSLQSRFDARDRALRAGALGRPWGMGWGGRWEGGAGWGTHGWYMPMSGKNHHDIVK